MDSRRCVHNVHGVTPDSTLLDALPRQLEFPLHGFHTARIRVQNKGLASCSIRIRAPNLSCISLGGCARVSRLAPGMHVYIDVAYDAALNTAAHLDDEITLKHETGFLTIPVIGRSSCTKFELCGEFDFGMVCAGMDVVKHLSLVNNGDSDGYWAIRIDSDCSMEARPSSGQLNSGGSATVTLVIPEIDPGEWQSQLQLQSGGDTGLMRNYSVTVQAVTATVEVQGDLGQPLHEVKRTLAHFL